MTSDRISDELLTAFLDGEASETEAARVAAALESDPSLAERVAALSFPRDVLSMEAEKFLKMAPHPPALADAATSHKGWLVAASLILGLLLGSTGMRLLVPESDWVDAVAAYQTLYVPETLAGNTTPRSVSDSVIARFEGEAGVSLAGATSLDGLNFKRAQVLGYRGRPLLQMAFTTEDGTPVALCLVRVDEPDRDAQVTRNAGLNAIEWVDGGMGFVLIGDVAASDLQKIAADLEQT